SRGEAPTPASPPAQVETPAPAAPLQTSVVRESVGAALTPASPPVPVETPAPTAPLQTITDSVYFDEQLQLLKRFAALCQMHGIPLVVGTTPLSPPNTASFKPGEFEAVANSMSRIVPLWDFSRPHPALQPSQRWRDLNHFTAEVAQVMIERMFGEAIPAEWS